MSEHENENRTEIRRLHGLLREIARLAEHASLTGSMEKGAPSAVRRYNQTLARLELLGLLSEGMFTPLPADASFDEVGVDSKLLAGYLSHDVQESQGDVRPHRPHWKEGRERHRLRNEDLDSFREVGAILRENFPAWFQEKQAQGGASEAPTVPQEEGVTEDPSVEPRALPRPDLYRPS